MGMLNDFKSASMVAKIALFVGLVANLCNWISFCTSEWDIIEPATGSKNYVGLWRYCEGDAITACNQLDGYGKTWFGVVQGFSVMGFVGINVAFFLIVMFVFYDNCIKDEEVGLASAIICFVSAVCWAVAVIVWVAEINEDDDFDSWGDNDVGYSWGLAIVALVLAIVMGILMFLARNK